MTLAVLIGAGSGMLHAVTGPDHVLSLGPVVLRRPRGSWRIGLMWGVGHAIGTLLLALPIVALRWLDVVDVSSLAAVGDRLVGLALVLLSSWSLWSLRHHHHDVGADASGGRGPVVVGLVHGATGAGALLLVLPVLVAGSALHGSVFLAAFAVGSTLAMALLTTCIARVRGFLDDATVARVHTVLTLAALALGVAWLALG